MRHLRALCAIADTGSLHRAARQLGVAQPSLTTQLRRIEQDARRRALPPRTHRLPRHPARPYRPEPRPPAGGRNACPGRGGAGPPRRRRRRPPAADRLHREPRPRGLAAPAARAARPARAGRSRWTSPRTRCCACVADGRSTSPSCTRWRAVRCGSRRVWRCASWSNANRSSCPCPPTIRPPRTPGSSLADLAGRPLDDRSHGGRRVGRGCIGCCGRPGSTPVSCTAITTRPRPWSSTGEVVTVCQPTCRPGPAMAVRRLHGDPLGVRLMLAARTEAELDSCFPGCGRRTRRWPGRRRGIGSGWIGWRSARCGWVCGWVCRCGSVGARCAVPRAPRQPGAPSRRAHPTSAQTPMSQPSLRQTATTDGRTILPGPSGHAARGLLDGRAVDLARVLDGDEDPPVLDDRAAGLGAVRHGQELLQLTAPLALRRDAEQAVVGAELVAVGGDPQVAVRVEGHVVRAGDRADLLLREAREVRRRVVRVARDEEQRPGEAVARRVGPSARSAPGSGRACWRCAGWPRRAALPACRGRCCSSARRRPGRCAARARRPRGGPSSWRRPCHRRGA